jgi:uncharacterized membrane protein
LNAESKFERVIGYILISGVAISLLLEVIGIILYYLSYGRFKILEDQALFIHGKNFFNFLGELIQGKQIHQKAVLLMTLGIAILMLTPYVRVILSVVHFLREKNVKYVLITLFVLALLTINLAVQ